MVRTNQTLAYRKPFNHEEVITMLSDTLQKALNDQIKHELYSSYLYLSMAAHLEATNLPGSARWMRMQSQEETEHALKFFEYILDRGGRVTLQAIDQPPATFGSLLSIFQQALEHEQKVTGLIRELYDTATKENDYATQVMLQWFITEQVEEEKTAGEVVEHLKRIGEQGAALFMMDAHLGQRSAED
jgi:ferritin